MRDPGQFRGRFPSASAAHSPSQRFADSGHASSMLWCVALVLTMACMPRLLGAWHIDMSRERVGSQTPRCHGAVSFGRRAALQVVCAESKGVAIRLRNT